MKGGEADEIFDSLPLDFIDPPLFGRVRFEKKIVKKDPKVVNDDVVSLGLLDEF